MHPAAGAGRPAGPAGRHGTTRYGALSRGGEHFLSSGGALDLTPSVAKALRRELEAGRVPVPDVDDGAAADTDVAASSGPYAQLVYRADVDGTAVRALTPVVRVDESALLTRVLGGEGPRGHDLHPPQPGGGLRPAGDPARPAGAGRHGGGGGADRPDRQRGAGRPDVDRQLARRALSAAGAHDPLQDVFTDTVKLQRYPSMHVPFDDELVLRSWDRDVSNMGAALFPSAATLLGLDPPGATWETALHGNPTAGPAMTLHVVEGGGGACSAVSGRRALRGTGRRGRARRATPPAGRRPTGPDPR